MNILKLHVNVFFAGYESPNIPAPYMQKTKESRKDTAIVGFREWEGEYTVFGGQKVKVKMEINEKRSSLNAVYIYLSDTENPLKHIGSGELNASMSWGGWGLFDWKPNTPKAMILRDDKTSTATHELFHTFGGGDAYPMPILEWEGHTPRVYTGSGINGNYYPDMVKSAIEGGYNPNDFTAKYSGPVRNNDVEMVILAFATGRRQNYQKQFPWTNVSEALGKGN